MSKPDPKRLRETFDIDTPAGTLTGRLYGTWRETGRRITVADSNGRVVFDTDDCFDLANARNTVDRWLDILDAQYRQHAGA